MNDESVLPSDFGLSSKNVTYRNINIVSNNLLNELPTSSKISLNVLAGKKQKLEDLIEIRNEVTKIDSEYGNTDVDSLLYKLFSTEEIEKLAPITVTNSESGLGVQNSVNDIRSGPQHPSKKCETCSLTYEKCPAHFLKIKIPKYIHPLLQGVVIDTLGSVCPSCSSLLIDDNTLKQFSSLSGHNRIKAIKEFCVKKRLTCKRVINIQGVKKCTTAIPIYDTATSNANDYRLRYTFNLGSKLENMDDKSTIHLRTPEEVFQIFDNISLEDSYKLGFRESHPRNIIMEYLLVPPYCVRPAMYAGGTYTTDDLTFYYAKIAGMSIKLNTKLEEHDRENIISKIYEDICIIFRGIDSKNKRDKNFHDLTQRLQGKKGYVRAYMLGKRVDFAARSPAGPHNMRLDEAGIPQNMVRKLTVPHKVTSLTIDELQNEYDNNRVIYIIPQRGKFMGQRMSISAIFRQKYPDYKLEIGDTVERCLRDGDIIILNRQPSLHKQSIIALYAVITNYRTLQIHLSLTTPLNADFDGDEFNIHVPQTIEAIAEAQYLLSVGNGLMNDENNSPLIAIVYDGLTSAYLLTKRNPSLEDDNKYFEYLSKYHTYRRDYEKKYYPQLETLRNNVKNYKGSVDNMSEREYIDYIKSKKLMNKYLYEYDVCTKENKKKKESEDEINIEYNAVNGKLNPIKITLKNSLISNDETELKLMEKSFEQSITKESEYIEIYKNYRYYSDKVGIMFDGVFEYCYGKLLKSPDDLTYKKSFVPPQLFTLKERLAKYNIPWLSERALFSATMPIGFYFDNKNITIRDGIMIKGVLSKEVLGTVNNGIIANIFSSKGGEAVVDFVSDFTAVVNAYLENEGFTLGIKDCLPAELRSKNNKPKLREINNSTNLNELKDNIKNDLVQSNSTIMDLTNITLDDKSIARKNNIMQTESSILNLTNTVANSVFEAKKIEDKTINLLGNLKNLVDEGAIESAGQSNSFVIMGKAGSKGSASNYACMTTQVGQQMVDAERIKCKLPGNRTLPVFPVGKNTPDTRGYCYNSLFVGLNPAENFMSAMGSREGSADTSIQTSNIGQLERILVKSNESVHIGVDGSVRTDDNILVMPIYGYDGFSPVGVTQQSINGSMKLLPVNTKQLASKINSIYENYTIEE